jgi:cell division protein ftsZ
MSQELFSIEEDKGIYGAKMKAIGVGGGGVNMINHMIKEGLDRIELIVANTDAQSLNDSLASTKIQLGAMRTKGLGAGMVPEVGAESAEESYEEIKNAIGDSDIVFIAAGLGGGTGTGAAPVVAKAAKELKALTIGVVTTPFGFEGQKRMKLALGGLAELKKECDSIVVVSNQKLLTIIDKKAGIKDSFKQVDNVLASAVSGMSSVILDSGVLNLDVQDIKKIMSYRGVALIGIGKAQGESAAQKAVEDALQSPLLDNMKINGAMGVLIQIKTNPNYSLVEIGEAMSTIESAVNESADIIFGNIYAEDMSEDEAEIMIIATGFEEKQEVKETPKVGPKNTDNHEIKRQKLKRVSGELFNMDATCEDLEEPYFIKQRLD